MAKNLKGGVKSEMKMRRAGKPESPSTAGTIGKVMSAGIMTLFRRDTTGGRITVG
jgi:hypothetical protein